MHEFISLLLDCYNGGETEVVGLTPSSISQRAATQNLCYISGGQALVNILATFLTHPRGQGNLFSSPIFPSQKVAKWLKLGRNQVKLGRNLGNLGNKTLRMLNFTHSGGEKTRFVARILTGVF